MSVLGGMECVMVLGCMRWAWRRCTYVGSNDTATWPPATPDEFEPVPRICRVILAVYEPDLHNPQYTPAGGYRLNPDWIVKRVTYEQALGRAPPYVIYVDHEHQEIVLAIRGLNLVKESDYKVLLDNRPGRQMFDGGYVHHGLLKSAIWVLDQESETLKRLWVENGCCYKMVFAGHSLGSGVASLLTVVVVNHRDKLGGIPRSLIRCYAVAPARCMSLNLAVKYADVIYSVILQDDFLPRTATPLEDIFKSIFWLVFIDLIPFQPFGSLSYLSDILAVELVNYYSYFSNQALNALDSLPCLLFLVCLRDTFIPEDRKLRDPRRLYAPGRMYHIVERKFCRCGRFPPEVRTAIPVDGRFEHIVLSHNATSDHAIIWIEREAEKALQRMKEGGMETVATPPTVQRFERMQTIEKEHKDALERAVSLNVPHAVPLEETPHDPSETFAPQEESEHESSTNKPAKESSGSMSSAGRTSWNDLVEKLFKRTDSGNLVIDRETDVPK